MKKLEFTAPVMEITKWDVEDVIVTSISAASFLGDLAGNSSSSTAGTDYSSFNN